MWPAPSPPLPRDPSSGAEWGVVWTKIHVQKFRVTQVRAEGEPEGGVLV